MTYTSRVAPLAGAWIETSGSIKSSSKPPVAPLAGAWIETIKDYLDSHYDTGSHPSRVRGLKQDEMNRTGNPTLESHPSRVRGLKLDRYLFISPVKGRTPRGCVD